MALLWVGFNLCVSPKGWCAGGLVLNVAMLRGGGILKGLRGERWGLVEGNY
jgi:hypothetical protein